MTEKENRVSTDHLLTYVKKFGDPSQWATIKKAGKTMRIAPQSIRTWLTNETGTMPAWVLTCIEGAELRDTNDSHRNRVMFICGERQKLEQISAVANSMGLEAVLFESML